MEPSDVRGDDNREYDDKVDEDDEDDDYFERMQSYIDGMPDNDDDGDDAGCKESSDLEEFADDDAYYDAILAANTSNSMVLPEDSVVWQYFSRETTQSMAVNASGHYLQRVTKPADIKVVEQWLFNQLPISSNIYYIVRKLFARSLENSHQLFVDSIKYPTLCMILMHGEFHRFVSVYLHFDTEDEIIIREKASLVVRTLAAGFESFQVSNSQRMLRQCLLQDSETLAGDHTESLETYSNLIAIQFERMRSSCAQYLAEAPEFVNWLRSKQLQLVKPFKLNHLTSLTSTCPEVSLPQGYKISQLSENDFEDICFATGEIPSRKLLVKYMISNSPAIGIRWLGNGDVGTSSDRNLVCWCLTCPFGDIGMLFTVEEHRRRGLASAAIHALVELQVTSGSEFCAPFAYFGEDDTTVKQLFLYAGFQKIDDSCSFQILQV